MRLQRLLLETETFEFREVRRGRLRRETGNRLRLHRAALGVDDFVHDGLQLARMHFHAALGGPEAPWPLRIAVEFDRDRARQVHLRVGLGRFVFLRELVNAQQFAHLPVHGHERVGETEHHRRNDDELAQHLAVELQPPRLFRRHLAQPDSFDKHHHEEKQCDAAQDQARLQVVRFLLLLGHRVLPG